ncbi:ATP-binding protein [Kitasatospora sp. GP82]|uniref:ATP-binding protein n=1 Tax=Kitasatospora sp. GP82 TaxID=3035089 RepID=UPI0024769541|nr:ATP-binding protein [Kitasatospora sp. GP82]MDH6123638.1 hypothetical protein [Kitasatospora sp. GP82]
MDSDIAAPDPAGLVASLSSLGYSLEAAIADLVDNSVSAGAKAVDVEFTWAGRESWMAVVDDGSGMTPAELRIAMTVAARGPSTVRSARDLGRFGVGLKSASFSQARQLTVASFSKGDWSVRTWDLDLIEMYGQWHLLRGADEPTTKILEELKGKHGKGTIVLWRRLNGYVDASVTAQDEATQKQFYAEVARTQDHLGMVFARFLSGARKIAMHVSGTAVVPWDPFMLSHGSIQRLPVEDLPLGSGTVRVESFVLPSSRQLSQEQYDLAAGPRGWLKQQGFYVYRRNRLILAGDWLGLPGLRSEEKYNLARIAVDIPAETDVDWGVDVRKASVIPPVALRRHLLRLAHNTRTRAAEGLRHRSRIAARTHGDPIAFAWEVRRVNGIVRCKINRRHPLVKEVLRESGERGKDLRALLYLLEETVPVTALRVLHETDTADDPTPFDEAGEADVTAVAVAERILQALIGDGSSPAAARERLRTMHPFSELRGFWSEA